MLLIEGFASGLLKNKNPFDWDRLIEQKDDITKTLDKWEDEYFNTFWNEFKSGFLMYIQNHTNLNNAQKADEIKQQLNKCWTEDSFYICVMNQARSRGDFYAHCPNADSQLIEVRNEGRCNAFVYRSIKGNSMEQIEYDNTKREVQALKSGKFAHAYNLEDQVNKYLLAEKWVRPDGLVVLMDYYCEGQIRSANCPDHEWGPGWWEDTNRLNDQMWYKLVVGLP